MGLLGSLFKKRMPGEEFAETVASRFRTTLQSNEFGRTVIEPFIEQGCEATKDQIVREATYLLQTANHFAIMQHVRDPIKGTRMIQLCTDRVVVVLHELGYWPLDESPRLATEYLARKEEFLAATDELPVPNPYLIGTACSIVACKHLFGQREVPEAMFGSSAKLFADKWAETGSLLRSVYLV